MKTESFSVADISKIRKKCLKIVFISTLICTLFTYFLYEIWKLYKPNESDFQTEIIIIVSILIILFLFILVIRHYLKNLFQIQKDIKNQIKYSFETRISSKKAQNGRENGQAGFFITHSIGNYSPLKISYKLFEKMKVGDKIYFEVLPISKELLEIKISEKNDRQKHT